MIRTLISKDVKLFFRNQFFALITVLGLVAVVVLYFVMPAQADDSLDTALYLPPDTSEELRMFLSDSFESELLDSQEELLQAVEDGDYSAGLILTDEMLSDITAGQTVIATVYAAPGTTAEMKQALRDLYMVGLNNINLKTSQEQININDEVIVLGPDLLGINDPIALRDSMLPMLLMMIFSIELMGLANLISEEIARGTVNALLVTPLGAGQFFAAKMIMGIGMAFIQVLLVIAAVGKLAVAPGIVIMALLIGSLLMTGVAFFISAFSRDFMSVMAWSVLFLLLLMLPGITAMIPTIASDWIKAIPTYYLVDTLHRALNYGAGWIDVRVNLLVLFASGVVFLGFGSLLLRRRFQ